MNVLKNMLNFNQLRGYAIKGGLIAAIGTVGLVVLANARPDLDLGKSADEVAAERLAFRAELLSEMDARFADENDALDVSKFRISTANGSIPAGDTKSKLAEARGRIDLELDAALKNAGLEGVQGPERQHFAAAWHCAQWLLDGYKQNSPGALLPETTDAYRRGDYNTVIFRCAGAEADLLAHNRRDEMHSLTDLSVDYRPVAVPGGAAGSNLAS